MRGNGTETDNARGHRAAVGYNAREDFAVMCVTPWVSHDITTTQQHFTVSLVTVEIWRTGSVDLSLLVFGSENHKLILDVTELTVMTTITVGLCL